MRKRFTKIICAAVATISAFSLMLAPACSSYTREGVGADTSADKVSSNGGFVTETGDYVYFINGVAENTAVNTFGEVVKGSVQRISKSDLQDGNYGNTQTIVPTTPAFTFTAITSTTLRLRWREIPTAKS